MTGPGETPVEEKQEHKGESWVSNRVIGALIAAFILGGVTLAISNAGLRAEVKANTKAQEKFEARQIADSLRMERRWLEALRELKTSIEDGTDDRWRRSDHDAYAAEIDRRLRELEKKAGIEPKFPFTEAKDDLLSELKVRVAFLEERLSALEKRKD